MLPTLFLLKEWRNRTNRYVLDRIPLLTTYTILLMSLRPHALQWDSLSTCMLFHEQVKKFEHHNLIQCHVWSLSSLASKLCQSSPIPIVQNPHIITMRTWNCNGSFVKILSIENHYSIPKISRENVSLLVLQ